jgi:hypothetical protein
VNYEQDEKNDIPSVRVSSPHCRRSRLYLGRCVGGGGRGCESGGEQVFEIVHVYFNIESCDSEFEMNLEQFQTTIRNSSLTSLTSLGNM